MISILVLGATPEELAELETADPSVEVLVAHGLDDALEKLGRNRRVDAVLITGGPDAGQIVAAIRDDSPAHPPIFVASGPGAAIPHTTPLPAAAPRQIVNVLKGKLEP